MIVTSFAPNIIRHLKTNDENAQVNFAGSFTQGMGAQKPVKASFLGIIVWWIVVVLSFAFSHLEGSNNLNGELK